MLGGVGAVLNERVILNMLCLSDRLDLYAVLCAVVVVSGQVLVVLIFDVLRGR